MNIQWNRVNTHARMHACTHMHTHIRTNTRTHTHAYMDLHMEGKGHIILFVERIGPSFLHTTSLLHTFLARCLKSSVLLMRPDLQSGRRNGLRHFTMCLDIYNRQVNTQTVRCHFIVGLLRTNTGTLLMAYSFLGSDIIECE